MTVLSAGIRGPSGRASHYVVPVLLIVLVATVVGIVLTDTHRSPAHHSAASHVAVRNLPPYWVVRPGDTMSQISFKTGLTVAQLEAFNPNVDPNNLIPRERLNLWRHPPVPRRPPPGPMFWTVKPGQSFGSIAAATHINIVTLEELNPNITPTSIQPGERLRLRR